MIAYDCAPHQKALREQVHVLKHRLAHNAVLGAQRQRRLLAFVGWKLAVHSANALVANSAAQRGQLEEREAMLGTLEARLAEARATHGRQLRSIQGAHAAELEAAHADLTEAQEALERLKTFSALKLREMADELERTQQQLREQQQGHLQFESKPMGPDGFGDSWDGGAPIGRVALGARGPNVSGDPKANQPATALRGPNVSGDPKANQPATALRLEMQSLKLVSYEAQLEEGAAKVHRLERKLRHVEAARAELAEYKRAHEGIERLRAEQHAEATRRVEALELLLANREEQANAAFAKRELEASAWRLKAEAKATAAEVLATAPLVLQRTQLRDPSGLLGTRQLSPRGRPQSEVISGAQLGARQPLPRGRPPTATAAAAPKAASSSLAAAEAAAFIVNKRASRPRPYDGDSPGTAPIGAALRPVGAPSDATKHVYDAPPDAGTPEASSASRIDTPPRRRQKSRKWAGPPTSVAPLLVAAAPPPASDEEVKRTRVRTLRAGLADGP